MRTSIATVCLSGTLDQKLVAARDAGFDGVEIFEPDLVASPASPEAMRARADELGLSLDLYQPFRDFEGVGPDLLEQNLRRAAAKFTLMNRLGIETMLLCSNVATARSGDEQLAATQLRQLGDLAERFGVRVAYEALAWGRFVDSYEVAARIVRLADHDRVGVCLDSFHILSKGHNPEAIETIPADKIFFVQLADAPLLSMDVLSWSRHHRLFPGEGGFDLGAFMGHLMRTGYDGPISLEIFNDTFRQSDPLATAIAARRSLRWLENEAAGWLGASAGGRAARMSAAALPAVEPPTDVNYVELRTEADGRHARAPGAARLPRAWKSPDEERRTLVAGGRAHRPRSSRSRAVPCPPWRGSDSRSATRDVALRRATELFAPQVHREESAGDEPLVGVRAPDGSEIFFGAEGDSEPGWVREFGAPSGGDRCPHRTRRPHQPRAALAALRRRRALLPLRARPAHPAFDGGRRARGSRPQPGAAQCRRHRPHRAQPGAARPPTRMRSFPSTSRSRHPMCSHSRDRPAIAASVPLDIPANYYDDIEARYDIAPALLADLRDLSVMYDRDESGEFLHFYTPPIGTVFLEVVERRHGYDGYGALNAPVRLAAQYQQRRQAKTGASA